MFLLQSESMEDALANEKADDDEDDDDDEEAADMEAFEESGMLDNDQVHMAICLFYIYYLLLFLC